MKTTRLLCLLLAATLALAAAGCGGSAKAPDPTPRAERSTPTPEPETDAPEDTETPDPEETAAPLPTPEIPTTPEPDYEAVYRELLDTVSRAVSEGDWDLLEEGQTGILEFAHTLEPDAALRDIGHAILDISGDGIPELLLGSISQREGVKCFGDMIFSVYTCVDGQPSLTLEGWYRNMYLWLGNGRFFNRGSGGAAYSIFGEYAISRDGASLDCLDYYFTYQKDENFTEIGCYHNTTGDWDVSVSEELPISMDEFWATEEGLEEKAQLLPLTPLSEYLGMETAPAETQPVSVRWAEETPAEPDFIADDSEYAVDVVFAADSGVRDFTVLSLTLEDVGEDGSLRFSTQPLCSWETLSPKAPLTVRLTFWGDIPNNGISFVDAAGVTRYFALGQSGLDGSLELMEFQA